MSSVLNADDFAIIDFYERLILNNLILFEADIIINELNFFIILFNFTSFLCLNYCQMKTYIGSTVKTMANKQNLKCLENKK